MLSRLILLTVFVGICTPVALLVSGRRVLISETKVQPGDKYIVEDYGDLGAAAQASLVCQYFTGRGVQTRVLWYSPSNVFGRDSCPFMEAP